MTRTLVRYRCEVCAYESPKWLGRCTECGEWGSVIEVVGEPRPAVHATPRSAVVPMPAVDTTDAAGIATGVSEFDRVLGGGLVAGSVTLVGGEPGMGKSTLVLQALGSLAARGVRCLLVSGEESPAQVRLRAERLHTLAPELLVVAETSLPDVVAHVEACAPVVLAVDSIQTLHDPDAPGAPGSVGQVRDAAQRLVRLAKERDLATIVVGHVTKDGALAGPRVLEHVVDTVLSFEGDRHHGLRMLRALKHRFGPTGELGVMEMTEDGLAAVTDPSALFLADRRVGASGSVVSCVMEGSRPICVEVQALVGEEAKVPRRIAQAIESNRLAMLVAVLQQHGGVECRERDVYASIAGGVRVAEPGVDLAVAIAVAGARNGVAVEPDTIVIGEVGLGGEVRQVPHGARRLLEAGRVGYCRAIVPVTMPDVDGINLVRVPDVRAALDATLQSGR
jgi:DNA repair protein RadA/Sms